MAVDIIVPELGESIVDATVGQWLKQDGETVTEGDPVVELETEKVNMEVPAPASGVLKIARQEGETVAIGESLGQIGDDRAGAASGEQATAATGAATTSGSAPSAASTPAPASASAATPTPNASTATLSPMNGHSAPTASAPVAPADQAHATPLARRVAEEHGVNLATIQGTGPGGRITQDDVNGYLASATPPPAPAVSVATAPAPQAPQASPAPTATISAPPPQAPVPAPAPRAPTPSTPSTQSTTATTSVTGRREERIRMTRRRQTIAQRLKETQNTAAMLTTFNEVDMSAIMDLRKRRRDAFKERYGVSLGFMSFFTRAVIGALKAFPRLNAEIQGNEIVLKRYYDIGIAVSTDEGLVVPVLRDADRMTFAQIEQGIAELAKKAREGRLTLEDLQGGTFTITNGGTFGSLLSTPILNGPQVGILGMHKIEERPIAVKGQVEIHPMMYLAVSYDHRIVDGAEAVGFLVRVKELLEDPETLLLEG